MASYTLAEREEPWHRSCSPRGGVLVATGLVHALGHYSLMSAQGDTDAVRQLLAAMRGNPQDMGLGFVRTMFDIVAGFSLTFSILPVGMGLVGLLVLRREGRTPGLLREVSIAYAGIYGIMTGVALRYWFPAPRARGAR